MYKVAIFKQKYVTKKLNTFSVIAATVMQINKSRNVALI